MRSIEHAFETGTEKGVETGIETTSLDARLAGGPQ
jgi:hypothetical protein